MTTATDATTALARAAFKYIDAGLILVPLLARRKIPCLDKGYHLHTPTRDEMRAWWTKWPDANIGIRLQPSGLVVVDIDSPEAQVEVEQWGLPPTLTARAGRGHHYYLDNDGTYLPTRRCCVGDSGKIDVLAEGYVVAPPSVHPTGYTYAWINHAPRATPPEWVRTILDPPQPARIIPHFDQVVTTDITVYGQRALDDECAKLASHPAGGRGTQIYRTAVQLGELIAGGQIPQRDAWAGVYAAAVACGAVEFDGVKSVEREMQRGFDYGMQTPRGPAPTVTTQTTQNAHKPPPKTATEAAKPERAIVVRTGPTAWHFGATVRRVKTTIKDGQTDEDVVIIASNIWPTARTRAAETDAHGVAFVYRDKHGTRGTMVCGAEAWTGDRASANRFAADAARAGVAIKPRAGADLAYALGWWSDLVEDAPAHTTVIRPGWHRNSVYVNGATVHGAPWHYTGATHRGQTRGTLDTWNEHLPALACTHGTRLALAMSFCGSLLAPLARSGWVLHLAGASTTGKTRACKLAASVWFDPAKTSTWNGTANGIEQTLEGYSGALVVLDEIKEAAPRQVGDIVHRISDNAGRVRSNRTGTGTQRQRTWSLTGLSTGETTVGDYLGAYAQGGHLVRCVDLWIERGEATVNALHSDRIDEFGRRCHGVAGDAFAAYLVDNLDRFDAITQNAHNIAGDLVDTAPDAEAQRVLGALALVGAAIIEANRAGVWPLDDAHATARAVIGWAMRKIVDERGDTTSPEARALRTLRDLMQSRPALFPRDVDYATARDAMGVWHAGKLHTTEGMLKSCETWRAAGVSARRWLSWLAQRGDARRLGHARINGVQGKWWVLDFAGDHDDIV